MTGRAKKRAVPPKAVCDMERLARSAAAQLQEPILHAIIGLMQAGLTELQARAVVDQAVELIVNPETGLGF